MRRGFKAEAERIAAEIREQIGCKPDAAAPLDKVAKHLAIELISADKIIARSRLIELQRLQDDAFSAGTFRRPSGSYVVVYNPLHSTGRIRSDQAHEIAHIVLGHNVRTVEHVGRLTFLTCDLEQEEEADWLAGCLLLPRGLLLKAARQGLTAPEIADRHDTSHHMARFRLNASGVLVQIGRARAAKNRAATT